MLKWIDYSTPKCESWDLVWDNNQPYTGMPVIKIYNAKDENTGNLIGRWAYEMSSKFGYFQFAKDTNHAKHCALGEVILMATEMSKQAGDMVLELAREQ